MRLNTDRRSADLFVKGKKRRYKNTSVVSGFQAQIQTEMVSGKPLQGTNLTDAIY